MEIKVLFTFSINTPLWDAKYEKKKKKKKDEQDQRKIFESATFGLCEAIYKSAMASIAQYSPHDSPYAL